MLSGDGGVCGGGVQFHLTSVFNVYIIILLLPNKYLPLIKM